MCGGFGGIKSFTRSSVKAKGQVSTHITLGPYKGVTQSYTAIGRPATVGVY